MSWAINEEHTKNYYIKNVILRSESFFKALYIFVGKADFRGKRLDRERKIFYSKDHSPNGGNWAELSKNQDQGPSFRCPTSVQDLKLSVIICCFPIIQTRNLNRSGEAWIQSSTHKGLPTLGGEVLTSWAITLAPKWVILIQTSSPQCSTL